ncbi:hypothetical protein VD0002_g6480 [Verticillium dahliae]|uniref:N-acetylglutamate synthase n=1 Tax=Verticillium dahliae (strain VdLs.17 / ATCC MYA-4575 / FGSC 10137) TaxID=498257 RepID=G2WVA3_VERDV|nr:uncharacterized protein VDAG_02244 [Verticillium dahliae VdLs.17]EGY20228.1 hypothetical protein VDAG_02244 [Verticillium dahliae VdLs.17]KAH6689975.1 hypothetical protein EV126DRAFT_445323 [Verticillium dahliae]PNH61292.1 hypothetical protein VD0002_g6480 [Verticillium dahliae]
MHISAPRPRDQPVRASTSTTSTTSTITTSSNMATAAPLPYHNKIFTSASNTANGEVSSATRFHYRQEGKIVWAEYGGGSIVKGFLIATVADDESLDMRYEHVNVGGALMTGRCRSVPERLADGRLRMHETWRWTSGDGTAGESVVEEVRE